MTDLESRLRETFSLVAESVPCPPLPDLTDDPAGAVQTLVELFEAQDDPGPTRRHRRVVGAVTALALLGGGFTVAAATHLSIVPNAVTSALGWTPQPGAINPYPQTARKLLSERGPNGERLELWYADATDDSYCISLSPAIDRPASVGGPTALPDSQPAEQDVSASYCGGTVGDRYWNTFGGQAGSSSGTGSPTTFIERVTGATTVRLAFDDGTSRALPVADGFTAGWVLPDEKDLDPVLVGYTTDGTEMGRVPID